MLPVNYIKDECCGVISRNKTESDRIALDGYKIRINVSVRIISRFQISSD